MVSFPQVYLREENWKIGNASGRNVSSYEMVMVLSELTELWIRAKWSNVSSRTVLALVADTWREGSVINPRNNLNIF